MHLERCNKLMDPHTVWWLSPRHLTNHSKFGWITILSSIITAIAWLLTNSQWWTHYKVSFYNFDPTNPQLGLAITSTYILLWHPVLRSVTAYCFSFQLPWWQRKRIQMLSTVIFEVWSGETSWSSVEYTTDVLKRWKSRSNFAIPGHLESTSHPTWPAVAQWKNEWIKMEV